MLRCHKYFMKFLRIKIPYYLHQVYKIYVHAYFGILYFMKHTYRQHEKTTNKTSPDVYHQDPGLYKG